MLGNGHMKRPLVLVGLPEQAHPSELPHDELAILVEPLRRHWFEPNGEGRAEAARFAAHLV